MRFLITSTQIPRAEVLYAYVALVTCAALLAVFCLTSLVGGAVPVGEGTETADRNWIKETAFYEFFGFSELPEEPPSGSVYTEIPAAGWGRL